MADAAAKAAFAAAASGEGGDAKQVEMFTEIVNKMSREESKDFKMTKEEGNKLIDAFKKPEFRKMFHEYIQEISDPKNRAEYEAHLRQLEKDSQVPSDKELLKPLAGFCVKTKTQDGSKMFINICHHDKIEAPSVEKTAKGQNWSLPNSLGPPRMENDNKGTPTVTFDIVFNTQALTTAARSKAFKGMLCDVAIEQVEAKYRQYQRSDTTLSRKYHILKKVACMGGTPAIMTLSKEKAPKAAGAKPTKAEDSAKPASRQERRRRERAAKKGKRGAVGAAAAAGAGAGASDSADGSGSTSASAAAAAHTPRAAVDRRPPPKTTLTPAAAAAVAAEEPEEPLPEGMEVPAYTVVHRGEFDYGDFGLTRTNTAASKRPKQLVVRIELPRLKSVKRVELDVEERRLSLLAPKKYRLRIRLPYAVNDASASASFNKSKRQLEVTLPVIAPEPTAPQRFVEPVSEPDEAEPSASDPASASGASAAAAASGDGGDGGEDTPAAASPPTSKATGARSHSRWVSEGAAAELTAAASAAVHVPATPPPAPEAAVAAPATAAASAPSSTTAPAPARDTARVPKHSWRQNAKSLTVLLQVPGIDAASVDLQCTATRVELTFAAADGQAYKFAFTPEGSVSADRCRVDVASANMVLLLPKAEAATGMWTSLGKLEEPSSSAAAAAASTATGDTAGQFVAARKFAGERPGYVFKSGGAGLGYYWDELRASALPKPKPVSSAPAPAPAAKAARVRSGGAGGAGAGAGAAASVATTEAETDDGIIELGADGAFDISSTPPAAATKAKAKAVPAPRRAARIITHASTSSSKSSSPKRPHPITGSPELGSAAGAAASTGSGARSSSGRVADMSAVNLENTMMYEID